MVEMGVITPVYEDTDWCNNLVFVTKVDKSLRICLDPQNLIKLVQIPNYYIPSSPDILLTLAKGKHFMTLDCKSGYWATKLDRRSSFLTTFNTPFKGYRFLRFAFGIMCSGSVFAEHVTRIFDGILVTFPVVDDLKIQGVTE